MYEQNPLYPNTGMQTLNNQSPPNGATQTHMMENPMIMQLNPNTFAACNEGLANGFGAMFFNIRDPTFKQTNDPIKQ
jgi:hypothetical protein